MVLPVRVICSACGNWGNIDQQDLARSFAVHLDRIEQQEEKVVIFHNAEMRAMATETQ